MPVVVPVIPVEGDVVAEFVVVFVVFVLVVVVVVGDDGVVVEVVGVVLELVVPDVVVLTVVAFWLDVLPLVPIIEPVLPLVLVEPELELLVRAVVVAVGDAVFVLVDGVVVFEVGLGVVDVVAVVDVAVFELTGLTTIGVGIDVVVDDVFPVLEPLTLVLDDVDVGKVVVAVVLVVFVLLLVMLVLFVFVFEVVAVLVVTLVIGAVVCDGIGVTTVGAIVV